MGQDNNMSRIPLQPNTSSVNTRWPISALRRHASWLCTSHLRWANCPWQIFYSVLSYCEEIATYHVMLLICSSILTFPVRAESMWCLMKSDLARVDRWIDLWNYNCFVMRRFLLLTCPFLWQCSMAMNMIALPLHMPFAYINCLDFHVLVMYFFHALIYQRSCCFCFLTYLIDGTRVQYILSLFDNGGTRTWVQPALMPFLCTDRQHHKVFFHVPLLHNGDTKIPLPYVHCYFSQCHSISLRSTVRKPMK
jgi:hypothetical protein